MFCLMIAFFVLLRHPCITTTVSLPLLLPLLYHYHYYHYYVNTVLPTCIYNIFLSATCAQDSCALRQAMH